MQEIQFREPSADTGSSKNIKLHNVKRKHSWMQGNNKIQEHFCWRSGNHCYKDVKQKILQADVRNKIRLAKIKLHCCSLLKDFSESTADESGGFQYQI